MSFSIPSRLPVIGPPTPFGWPADDGDAASDDLPERPLAGLTILLAEDDPDVQSFLCAGLARAGATVLSATSILKARAHLCERRVDVRVVDRYLRGGDGYVQLVLDRTPAHDQPVGLMCISRYPSSADMQLALDQEGAVLLSKPFSTRLLIRAVLRACAKASVRTANGLPFGSWTLDPWRRVLLGKDRRIDLSLPELAILRVLLELPDGESADAWTLSHLAWGEAAGTAGDKRVRHVIFRLRRLIDDPQHEIIRHAPGRGYWIVR